jgi:hypothetical protein
VNAVAEFAPTIRSRVPWDEYVALPGISITRLKEIKRSPLHYFYRLTHPKESPSLSLGKAAHAAVLEPERYEREYVVWRRRTASGNLGPRSGQYWDAFVAENPGMSIVTEDEHELALSISKAVRAYAPAMRYLESGEPEVTMQWEADGIRCRTRVDWFARTDEWPHLVELKTADDCRVLRFGNQAARFGYHMQLGWHFDAYRTIKGVEPRMKVIAVESEPPHAVAVYDVPSDVIDQGRDDYQQLMLRLVECQSTGHFPGPQEVEEALTLPSWVYPHADDISELGLEMQ